VKYADKHGGRALTPAAVTSSAGFRLAVSPRRLVSSLRQLRETGNYIWSRPRHRRSGGAHRDGPRWYGALLLADLPSVPAGALDPFLDFIAEKIGTESAAAQAAPTARTRPGQVSP
jgi:hypothetical protein